MNFSPAVEQRSEARASGVWEVALLLFAIAVHSVPFITHKPVDLIVYVSHWYERVHSLGFEAFSQPFSNYTPPYLYLLWASSLLGGDASSIFVIKWVAVAGGAWLTLALYRLFDSLQVESPGLAALAALLLPSLVLNISLLGQADTFWVAACVLALNSAIKDRLPWVAFWSGVAFALKAQAVFFAPFVMHLFLKRRASWWCWAIPAFVYVAAMLPAWLAGWNWWYLVNVYFRQAAWQPEGRLFISNGGSWWTIFGHFAPEMAIRFFPFGYVLAALGTVAYLRLRSHYSPTGLLAMATLSAAGLPFLLPGMHERFFILADVLAFCLAVRMRTRPAILAAVFMQIGSAVPVVRWAYQWQHIEIAAPLFILGAILILIEIVRSDEGPTAPAGHRA